MIQLNILPPEIREIIYKNIVMDSIMNPNLKKELFDRWLTVQFAIVTKEALQKNYLKAMDQMIYLKKDIERRDDISLYVKEQIFMKMDDELATINNLLSDVWYFVIKDGTFDDVNRIITKVEQRNDCFICFSQYLQTRYVIGYKPKPYYTAIIRGYIFFRYPVSKYIIGKIIRKGSVAKKDTYINLIVDDLYNHCSMILQAGNPYIRPDLTHIIDH